MKCLNTECINELTEYEMKRIDVKFSWQRFCIKCRQAKKRIKYINCQMCDEKMSFIVGSYNVVKIYCSKCAEIRHRSRNTKLLN